MSMKEDNRDLFKELLKSQRQAEKLCKKIFDLLEGETVITVLTTTLTVFQTVFEQIKEDKKLKEFLLFHLLLIIRENKE